MVVLILAFALFIAATTSAAPPATQVPEKLGDSLPSDVHQDASHAAPDNLRVERYIGGGQGGGFGGGQGGGFGGGQGGGFGGGQGGGFGGGHGGGFGGGHGGGFGGGHGGGFGGGHGLGGGFGR